MNRLLYILVALLLWGVECRSGETANSGDINWCDSAFHRYQVVQNHYNLQQTDSVMAKAPAVLDFCRRHGQWFYYYTTWSQLAEMYVWAGDFSGAVREAQRMHDDAAQRHSDYGLSMANFMMGQAYAYQDNYREAARCLDLALKQYPDDENPSRKNVMFSYFAQTLYYQPDHQRMDSLMQQWRAFVGQYPVVEDSPDVDVRANWRFLYFQNDFLLRLAQNRIQQAATALDSAEYYEVIDGNVPLNVAILLGHRVKLSLARHDLKAALAYNEREMAMSRDIGSYQYMSALANRQQVFEEMGRYQEALAVCKEYHALNDSITQADNRQQLNELNKRFEVEEYKMQTELERQRTGLLLAGVVVLLAAFGCYIAYTRHINKKNRVLYNTIRQSQAVEVAARQADGPQEPSREQRLYDRACRLMVDEQPYTNPDLNRNDLARLLSTNENYVAEAIRQCANGQTFTQFVNHYRLMHASRLLADTQQPIEAIAYESGFNNRQTFGRIFREQYGMTPSQFRKAGHHRL